MMVLDKTFSKLAALQNHVGGFLKTKSIYALVYDTCFSLSDLLHSV